jgi:hypothetical protein
MQLFPKTKKFINRQMEIAQAEEVLRQVKNLKPPAVKGVIYFGIAGIGKSRLLQQIKLQCRRKSLVPASIDFQEQAVHSHLDYLLHLADQLEKPRPHSGLREAVLDAINLAASPKAHAEQALPVFAGALKQRLKARPLVLLLDSCERCVPELFDWIGQQFLVHLVNSNVGPIALFLAGCGPQVAESNWPIRYVRATQNHHVAAFDFADTKKHIAAIDKAKRWRGGEKSIHELSAGHPLSTQALVYFLQSLNVDVRDIPQRRKQLAQRLHDEVISRHLLPQQDLWPQDSFELACVPRRFDAALLEKIASDYTHYWYSARMQQLQKSNIHLIHVGHGKPAYQLETTLRKLLYTAVSILKPERVLEINQALQKIYENELQQATLVGRPSADSLLELLYHHIQVQMLYGRPPAFFAEDLLRTKLEAHFHPDQRDDLVELNKLRDLLARDFDFLEVLGKPGIERLLKIIDDFAATPPKHEIFFLSIRHSDPSEYEVSWFVENTPLIPSRTVHSDIKFSIKEWRDNPGQRGRIAFATYLPDEAQEFLKAQQEPAIVLTTNTMDIPFELMHDGREFLCLSRPFGRQLEMVKAPKYTAAAAEGGWRALVVGDPTGNLPSAAAEAEAVAELLAQASVKVDRLIGKEAATLNSFVGSLVLNPYHLIHFAGHAFFNRDHPALSGLGFTANGRDVTVTAEEIKRYLKSPAFVFFSACEAAAAERETTQLDTQGTLIQNLAVAALEGGACGCLGPMWKIEDDAAKDFAISFYSFLLQGKVVGEAVRLARKQLRKRLTDSWASWVLFCNPYTHPFGAAPM